MSSTRKNPAHPGLYVRANVIPKGMSVKLAAETIGVGRPALSNFLNGNAALSSSMAAKFEKAFGINAKELMKLQSEYEATGIDVPAVTVATKSFVPPFLRAKANEIEDWAKSISSRTKLAVLLRTLVHSTCGDLVTVDFPGNDDAERPGWDGQIETSEGNPWVPIGMSGWEFGTSGEPTTKANKDYKKSISGNSKEDRAKMTFVFVTPRRWPAKDTWCAERRAEGEWKNVLAFDSSDLEQWLEQSIPAQVWFANELGQDHKGTQALDKCWDQWNADCEPQFTTDIFDEAEITSGKKLIDQLLKSPDRTIRIAADSKQEGLAFLYCVLASENEELRALGDKIVVFNEPGPLTQLTTKSNSFIPVATTREVEQELALLGQKVGGIVISPRTMVRADADIILDTLSWQAFENALSSMELGRDEIERLSNESGRSLTVLRRRLAKSPALRTPDWSSTETLAKSLFPLMLAGAWKADKEADQLILAHLVGCEDFEEVEGKFSELQQIESAPVWSIGSFRGIVSKMDALYAIHRWVTPNQLTRFFEAAELVLSERDPSLDLPEEDRWAAGIYGKTREISAALREGLADSMVLLAIHGKQLFNSRIGIDPSALAAKTVRKLFDPLTADTLESQSNDLPMYAEAAPEEFLRIIEGDLASSKPQLAALMRPAESGLFGSNPRTGLLWALEALAWSPNHIARVTEVLAHLAEMEADDNWGNKPSQTLLSIFRSWMPQTGAPLAQRIAVLDGLIANNPSVAWRIVEKQFEPGSRVGDFSNKPKWRDYAFGYGEPVINSESWNFVEHCVEAAINWKTHSKETLADLIRNIDGLSPEDQSQVWGVVSRWSENADDEERALVRETIRTTTKRKIRRNSSKDVEETETEAQIAQAMECYKKLEPKDLIDRHAWLFKNAWVEESWDEIQSEDFDFKARDARISKTRLEAVKEIYEERGMIGVIRLAQSGSAPHIVGDSMIECLSDRKAQLDFVSAVLSDGDFLVSRENQLIIDGVFFKLGNEVAIEIIDELSGSLNEAIYVKLLSICRFDQIIWKKVDSLDGDLINEYWTTVPATWRHQSEEELHFAVSRLLAVDRALSALHFVHLDLKSITSDRLYQLLKELPNSKEDTRRVGQMDQHTIREVFKLLNERKTFSQEKMAQLEFQYLEVFKFDRGEIPNLEKQIGENPSLFCDAIGYAYKRDDGEQDEELTAEQKSIATNAHTLLETISKIPGQDECGEAASQALLSWIEEARKLSKEKGRLSSADYQIGRLLSGAPKGEDGVWPSEPVRAAMDTLMSERMAHGFEIGRHNARGAHFRGEGGAQERELAVQYEDWAKSIELEHPRMATVLRRIAETYQNEADWHDNEASVRKRLRY